MKNISRLGNESRDYSKKKALGDLKSLRNGKIKYI